MKVAVASEGLTLKSQMHPYFGRARCFLIVDTDSGTFTTYDNTENLHSVHTAGMQAAGNIISLGVNAVITRSIGPKAFATLEAGNVKVYTTESGTVADVIEDLKSGRLQPARKANVQDHRE